MKRALMVLGVVFLLGVAVVAGILVWAHRAGQRGQDRFFAAVAAGDPGQLTALFHPALAQKVDPPVLAIWMAAVNERLGAYQGLSRTGFETKSEAVEGGARTTSQGTARFAGGEAEVKLVSLNGQLVEFEVASPKLEGWFHPPVDSLYRERASEFLRALVDGRDEAAYSMMHPELQKVMPLAAIGKTMQSVRAEIGAWESVEYENDTGYSVEDGLPTLRMVGLIRGTQAKAKAMVKFQFPGLRGELLGFEITPISPFGDGA